MTEPAVTRYVQDLSDSVATISEPVLLQCGDETIFPLKDPLLRIRGVR